MSKDGGNRLRLLPPRVRANWTPERHRRTEARVWDILQRKQRRRRFAQMAAMGALPAMVALTFWAVSQEWRGASKSPAPPAILSSYEGLRRIDLPAGSVATLLTSSTRLRILRADAEHISAVLEEGKAAFNISPTLPGTFALEVHGVFMEVMGTRFVVESHAEAASVRCESGSVQVRWPGGERTLAAGTEATFPTRLPNADTGAKGPVVSDKIRAQPAHPPLGSRFRSRRDRQREGMVQMAKVDASGEQHVETLLEQANVARRDGDPRRAVMLLDQAIASDRNRGLAAAAALTKGRVLLDELGDAEAACKAFAWVRKNVPQSPLSEDALALEAMALARRGQIERAGRLIDLYRQKYPNGAHRSQLRALVPLR